MPIAVQMIVLHSVEGHEVTISSRQVTSLRASKPDHPNTLLTGAVNCVIGLADGKFVTVIESCADVREMIEGK
jgi:hypothetical protein